MGSEISPFDWSGAHGNGQRGPFFNLVITNSTATSRGQHSDITATLAVLEREGGARPGAWGRSPPTNRPERAAEEHKGDDGASEGKDELARKPPATGDPPAGGTTKGRGAPARLTGASSGKVLCPLGEPTALPHPDGVRPEAGREGGATEGTPPLRAKKGRFRLKSRAKRAQLCDQREPP